MFIKAGLSIAILLSCLTSCFKAGGKCEEPDFVELSDIRITYKDSATNSYYFTSNYSKYNRDEISVTSEGGEQIFVQLVPIDNPMYYMVTFSPIYESGDTLSYKQELCKKFFVHLDQNTTDTLTVCFKSIKTTCGSIFENFKVNYRNKNIFNQQHIITAHLTISK